MKVTDVQAALASAVVLLSLPAGSVASSHKRFHQLPNKKHTHLRSHTVESPNSIVKRGTCAFPTDDPNLVAVTPDAENAGWAMSPDQPCKPGHYCPIACKPGMVMAQWSPDSSYSYPSSMVSNWCSYGEDRCTPSLQVSAANSARTEDCTAMRMARCTSRSPISPTVLKALALS
jgi:hypothetical protein